MVNILRLAKNLYCDEFAVWIMKQHSSGMERTLTGVPVVFGSLNQAGDFASDFDEASRLGITAPVFTSHLTAKRINKLGGSSVFRIGAIPFDDCLVMTIRYQKGKTMAIWLADASDPDLWSAVDNLRTTGEAGFSFVSGDLVWFSPYRTQDIGASLDVYRQALGRSPNGFMPRAAALIASKAMSSFTSSMLQGVDVTYAQVSILGTAQVQAAARAMGATVLQL